jgi:hypothetical protein
MRERKAAKHIFHALYPACLPPPFRVELSGIASLRKILLCTHTSPCSPAHPSVVAARWSSCCLVGGTGHAAVCRSSMSALSAAGGRPTATSLSNLPGRLRAGSSVSGLCCVCVCVFLGGGLLMESRGRCRGDAEGVSGLCCVCGGGGVDRGGGEGGSWRESKGRYRRGQTCLDASGQGLGCLAY